MGCGASVQGARAAEAAKTAETQAARSADVVEATMAQEGAPAARSGAAAARDELAEPRLIELGVHVPAIPGDIGLCGTLSEEVMRTLNPKFASWVYMNTEEDKGFLPDVRKELQQSVEVRPFPGPDPMPTEEQIEAALEAIDKLPRPMMLQCTSGNRAGALLLMWYVRKYGYSPEALTQLAVDLDLKFWLRCEKCGPMREWLLKRLPPVDIGRTTSPADGLMFSQLFDTKSSAYTYMLADQSTKEAIFLDLVPAQTTQALALLGDLGLNLRYVVYTHAYADHIMSGGAIHQEAPAVRTVISKASGVDADWQVGPGEKVAFGRFALEAIATPGHTEGCTTWMLAGSPSMLFTGDALSIRSCGLIDLQLVNSGKLYDSVHSKIFSLPGDTAVYPGHDYKGRNVSTVEEEKRYNSWFAKSREEFVQLMSA